MERNISLTEDERGTLCAWLQLDLSQRVELKGRDVKTILESIVNKLEAINKKGEEVV